MVKEAFTTAPMRPGTPVSADAAETLALRAIAFVAAEADLLGAFLAQSGADPSELGARLADRAFLAGVLDFVLSDDAVARAFSQSEALPPGAILAARGALPGGGLRHWT